jgi:hypothetical protein
MRSSGVVGHWGREHDWFYSLAAGCFFKSVSPLASIFLLLRQKKETKEKATPGRSKARNKINDLRRWRNSAAANVGDLRHSPA